MRDYAGGVVLSFDKPLHWTSFDLVGKVRNALCRRLGQKKFKVGHAGTLDPLATGVVLVCTGRATKQIETLINHTKEYVATLQFGGPIRPRISPARPSSPSCPASVAR